MRPGIAERWLLPGFIVAIAPHLLAVGSKLGPPLDAEPSAKPVISLKENN